MYKAEILADSVDHRENRITTMKITFPRMMLAELNTHRMFTRNSASSRAIPAKKMIQMVKDNPFIPIAWQKDHKGMQGTEYWTEKDDVVKLMGGGTHTKVDILREQWLIARNYAVQISTNLHKEEVTKQLCNRLLEPFMWHTVIITATEWENFFKLRCPQYDLGDGILHASRKDALRYISETGLDKFDGMLIQEIDWLEANKSQADIHIQAIAELMWDAKNESTPKELKPGEYHIPFSGNMNEAMLLTYCLKNDIYSQDGGLDKHINDLKIKIAIARCARISYETLGAGPKIDFAADVKLYKILADSGHWSPFEHVAKCMTDQEYLVNVKGEIEAEDFIMEDSAGPYVFYDGKSLTCEEVGWSRNFRGFIQERSIRD